MEEEWNTLTNDFISYLTYNEIFVVGLIPTLSKQKVALEELRYGIRNADCSMDGSILNNCNILFLRWRVNRMPLKYS